MRLDWVLATDQLSVILVHHIFSNKYFFSSVICRWLLLPYFFFRLLEGANECVNCMWEYLNDAKYCVWDCFSCILVFFIFCQCFNINVCCKMELGHRILVTLRKIFWLCGYRLTHELNVSLIYNNFSLLPKMYYSITVYSSDG